MAASEGEVQYLPETSRQSHFGRCINRGVSSTSQQEKREARKDEIEQAVKRVLTGHSFRSSAQCQSLLRYIVEHSLSRQDEMLRERVIGIKVFGRAPDYDAGNDPIVRARAAEVRKRLAQHYMQSDGAGENIRIDVPPGSYRAVFSAREISESSDVSRETGPSYAPPANSGPPLGEQSISVDNSAEAGISRTPQKLPRTSPFRSGWIPGRLSPALIGLTLVVGITGVFGFLAGYFSRSHPLAGVRKGPRPQALSATSNDPVETFWAPFIEEDHSPIIAYSDAMFLIDGSGDLFRFRQGASDNRGVSVDSHLARRFASNPGLVASAGPLFYDNGYTGTGDLKAAVMLVGQLTRLGATPLIESSYDLTTNDLEQHNVILLGSSAENLAVAQLVPTGGFLFENPESNRDPWSGRILNRQPWTGEQSIYATLRDPVTHVLQEDYAVISFQRGNTPRHQIAILEGIDTTGTDGAALFVTSKAGVEELSKALAHMKMAPETENGKAFQALVSVDVKKGYQVLDTHLVTVHPFDAATPAAATSSSSH
jgi:hypothetical protein